MKDSYIVSRIQDELEELGRDAQLRTLAEIRGVNLCSNDYLALCDDPRLKDAVVQAVTEARRVSSTGSRLLSGQCAEWDDIEREFAAFAGTEAALCFSSGYAANIGVLTSVLKPNDIVFSDSLNHASLIDGIRLSGARRMIYPHADLKALESALAQHAVSYTHLPTFAELYMHGTGEIERAALGVDAREGEQIEQLPEIFKKLREEHAAILVFVEASDAALLRRFSETRRPHPMGRDLPVREGIREERQRMEPIRRLADVTIDTTKFNVHELRQLSLIHI